MSTVVITGANGSIGRLAVTQALEQGRTVIATVRLEKDICSFEASEKLTVLVMDITSKDAVESTFAKIDQMLGGEAPHAIIHCAAVISNCLIERMTPELVRHSFDINTVGTLLIIQAAIPRLKGTGKNLVLCSSFWGRISGPMVGMYASSKWAMEALTDSARRETKGMGFSISLANIGGVRNTRMMDYYLDQLRLRAEEEAEDGTYMPLIERQTKQMLDSQTTVFSRPEKVASKLLVIADKKNPLPRYKIGTDAYLVCILAWLLPARWMDKGF